LGESVRTAFPLNDQKYWLGFSLVPGIGPKRLLRLNKFFGNLESAWTASQSALSEAGLDGQAAANFLQNRARIDLDVEAEKVRRANARIITLVDEHYPALLRQLDDAPPILYVRGTLAATDNLALSIVGTRKATRYGRDVSYNLAKHLVQQGITVISGLAHGVDGAAHRGAIDGGGRTIAVMGCGVDVVYPRGHKDLMKKVAESGAVISEFPIGAQPIASNFPRRNRIVSGLALGVLVTEAPINSGALITAGLAADQGREVFAVPANIYNPMGQGTNQLIQEGAKLVMTVEDILDELNIAHDVVQTRLVTEQVVPASDAEKCVLEYLDTDPIHIDDLVKLCGLPVAEVSSTLTILELKGVAQMVGHMQYSRVVKH
jgi:DNA processing protein